jgi:hypothetical protein
MNLTRKKIALEIKNITTEELEKDWLKLVEIKDKKIGSGNRTGNDIVDYFTFPQRLETIGNKKVGFYDFYQNKEKYCKKPYIRSFIKKNCKITRKNKTKVYYRIFSYYFGSINLFRPLNAIQIYNRFPSKVAVLDFTMGWGGRLVGACVLGLPKYIGIDNNIYLQVPYSKMCSFLREKSSTIIDLYFQDALTIDYTSFSYDLVLTSPPYYNLEIYHGNKIQEKETWENEFYIPLFKKTYTSLSMGGFYCLNVPVDLYEKVCRPLLGAADYRVPLKMRYRTSKYSEYVYVFQKTEKRTFS